MIRSKQNRGFTLVELLIAMLLSGMLAVILYSLFNTTSESLGEVSNLSDAQERIRFAMERLRTDVKGAGSQATPDSLVDIWQQPPPVVPGRVLGVSGYKKWQDQPAPVTALATANPNTSFDGFIVMGAFDYPVSFEVRGLKGPGDKIGEIGEHVRGLYKLYQIDPFVFSAAAPPHYPGGTSYLKNQWSTRLLRLMDRQGYFQFVELGAASTMALASKTMSFGLVTEPAYKDAGSEFGMDLNPEGDFAYDSALIDAYWYHVEAHPTDPSNLQLVRERLCAPIVRKKLVDVASFDPTDALPAACGGDEEVTVITDHVADFQVWFDCTSTATTSGAVVGALWNDDWLKPGDPTASCLGAAAYVPGNARVMHMRLSIYAPIERKDLLNFQFEDSTGAIAGAALTATPNVKLRTYDSVPTLTGAAPVVTMQSSVELINYVYRNPVNP